MSRTYRRKNSARACRADYLDPLESMYSYNEARQFVKTYREKTPKEIAKLRAYFHSDKHKEMTTPMWWIRMVMQVPLRRKERDLLKDVVKTKHLDEMEAIVFPLAKKPHVYYW